MTFDVTTNTALQAEALHIRDFLYISGWDLYGEPDTWGLWTGEDDVTLNVVSGVTGQTVSRSYVGGGTLLEVPPIISSIGLESERADFKVSQIHSYVRDMVFGARIRGARVELHRGIYSAATYALVSTPYVRFVGRLDTADGEIGAVGGEGFITLSCSPDVIDLTRSSPALKSDATLQKLHPGDSFRQYDTAGLIDRRWGTAKSKARRV